MRYYFYILLCSLFSQSLSAQNGLERIIVEKYYVSDTNDKTVDGDGGILAINSVTYRVFIDMLPGYIFQAAYGTPEHELRIATSTTFFNNEDRGARFPTYSRTQAQNNTVMLDSWLSAGSAMKDYAGVMKELDNGDNTVENADGVLQNDHEQAGIPLTEQDGAIAMIVEPVTVVGFFDTDLSILDDFNGSTSPAIISTRDGAWSSLNGSMGPDTTENIVLIGQFTTDGVFEFELNLQIRNQQTLGVENYVARNPTGDEILFAELIHIDSLDFMSSVAEQFLSGQHVTVYPNPFVDHVTIKLDESVELSTHNNYITLTSPNGVVVFSSKLTEMESKIDLTSLVPGIYMISLDLHNGLRYCTQLTRIQ